MKEYITKKKTFPGGVLFSHGLGECDIFKE